MTRQRPARTELGTPQLPAVDELPVDSDRGMVVVEVAHDRFAVAAC